LASNKGKVIVRQNTRRDCDIYVTKQDSSKFLLIVNKKSQHKWDTFW